MGQIWPNRLCYLAGGFYTALSLRILCKMYLVPLKHDLSPCEGLVGKGLKLYFKSSQYTVCIYAHMGIANLKAG